MKRLEAQWLSYRAAVVPQDAHPTQVEECRRSFYAGAAALHDLVMRMLDPGVMPTVDDVKKMGELYQELADFAWEVRPR